MGFWRVRFIRKGERKQDELSARTAADLISKLKAIREAEAAKAKAS